MPFLVRKYKKTNHVVPPGTRLNWKGSPLGKRKGWLHWICQGESYGEAVSRVREERDERKFLRR